MILKKNIFGYAALTLALFSSSCIAEENLNVGTCADYPPFEFVENGEFTGFDVELAKEIAKKLQKTAAINDMAFSALLQSLKTKKIDIVISALNITEEKKKDYDFSNEYYKTSMSVVYKKDSPIEKLADIGAKKIACQLGCNGHEKKIKEKAPDAEIVFIDNMNIAIESLKTNKVEYVFMDTFPAKVYCSKNKDLNCVEVSEYDEGGYAIAMTKGSELKEKINKALDELEKEGKLEELRKKWFEVKNE